MDKEIFETYRERFATHKAALIQDTDRYLAIDWRKSNGSGDYYVNYIIDKKRGSLIICGDLGDCIATWYNQLDAAKVKSYVKDVPYFVGKFQCASDTYTYNEDDVMADIKDNLGADFDCLDFSDSIDDFWENLKIEISESTSRDKFLPTSKLAEMIEQIDPDYHEWLYSCGERIHPRVYLWAIGFQMACDQLGL